MMNAIASFAAGAASSNPKLRKAAQDFEAMLLTDLMKFSDDEDQSAGETGLGGSESYTDLRNQAVASAMAANGGIGIGRMLLKKLDETCH